MKTSLQTHRRKAISPIIATILVVAMTIVAAGVLYTYFSTTASRAQNTDQIQVSASLAVPSGSGTGYGTITVTNSGSVALSALSVTADGFTFGTAPSFTITTPVPPGGSTSATFTITSAVSGEPYTMTILATYSNSATSNQVLTVTAT